MIVLSLMSSPSSLATALEHYQQSLTEFMTENAVQEPNTALSLLLSRDMVEKALKAEKNIRSEQLLYLKKLDQQLQTQRFNIVRILKLKELRYYSHPPETHWWWYWEPRALFTWLEKKHPWLDSFDWLWKFITLIALAVSVTFILSTLQRLLSGGLDTAGIFALVVQSTLTLAGGSALTQQGRAALEQWLIRWRIPKYYWQELGAVLSVVVFLGVFSIYQFYLPQLSTRLTEQGIRQFESGRLNSALMSYQQAIALRPDALKPHYYLGILYDQLEETNKAIEQYQLVVQSDLAAQSQPDSPQRLELLRAFNNLGRLYILQSKPDLAFINLERGLSLLDEQVAEKNKNFKIEQYNLLKNLGWARLKQKNYVDAANWLAQALDVEMQSAPAHCLFAQNLEGQGFPEKAKAKWELCLDYAVLSDSDEAVWIGLGRERLFGKQDEL